MVPSWAPVAPGLLQARSQTPTPHTRPPGRGPGRPFERTGGRRAWRGPACRPPGRGRCRRTCRPAGRRPGPPPRVGQEQQEGLVVEQAHAVEHPHACRPARAGEQARAVGHPHACRPARAGEQAHAVGHPHACRPARAGEQAHAVEHPHACRPARAGEQARAVEHPHACRRAPRGSLGLATRSAPAAAAWAGRPYPTPAGYDVTGRGPSSPHADAAAAEAAASGCVQVEGIPHEHAPGWLANSRPVCSNQATGAGETRQQRRAAPPRQGGRGCARARARTVVVHAQHAAPADAVVVRALRLPRLRAPGAPLRSTGPQWSLRSSGPRRMVASALQQTPGHAQPKLRAQTAGGAPPCGAHRRRGCAGAPHRPRAGRRALQRLRPPGQGGRARIAGPPRGGAPRTSGRSAAGRSPPGAPAGGMTRTPAAPAPPPPPAPRPRTAQSALGGRPRAGRCRAATRCRAGAPRTRPSRNGAAGCGQHGTCGMRPGARRSRDAGDACPAPVHAR